MDNKRLLLGIKERMKEYQPKKKALNVKGV